MNEWRRHLRRAAIMLCVVAIVLKVTIGALPEVDLTFDDESIYLEGARGGEALHWLARDSPLYPLWYRLLGVVFHDPIELYRANWMVLASALPLMGYALARRCGAGSGAAAIVAVTWVFCHAASVSPSVGGFATLVIVGGALATTFVANRAIALALASSTLSLASYARPELALPATLFAIGVAAQAAHAWRRGQSTARSMLSIALLSLGVRVGLRLGFGDRDDSARAFFAFEQHYALNVHHAENSTVDTWTNWEQTFRASFPTAQSLAQAIRENPGAFLLHLGRNALGLPGATWDLLSPMPYLPLAVALVLVAAVLVVLGLGIRGVRRRLVDPDDRARRLLPLLALVAVPAVGAAIFIYPRQHYLEPFALLALAMLAGCARGQAGQFAGRFARARRAIVPSALGAVFLLVPTRCPTYFPALLSPRVARCRVPLPERATALLLRSLHLSSPVVILEPAYSLGIYAGGDFIRVGQQEKHEPFAEFLRHRNVDVVVLNTRLRKDPRLDSDPEFRAFDNGLAETDEFVRKPVAGTDIVLAVKRSRLPAPP